MWNYTIWDKKFNGVDSYKQPKVIKYPYVLADVFNDIEDPSGNVRLLSTGSYVGYTTKEKAGTNMLLCDIPCRMTAPNYSVVQINKEEKNIEFI